MTRCSRSYCRRPRGRPCCRRASTNPRHSRRSRACTRRAATTTSRAGGPATATGAPACSSSPGASAARAPQRSPRWSSCAPTRRSRSCAPLHSRSTASARYRKMPRSSSTGTTSALERSPNTASLNAMEALLEQLQITVGDARLAGTLLAPATTVPGLLFVHGWGGSQEQDLERARAAAALGCICMTFDLRGHAAHRQYCEIVTREDNLRDLLAAYDALAGMRGVDRSSIGIVGSSYGGYLAAIVTSLRKVRWLALRAPALYKDAEWEKPKHALHADADLAAFRRRELRAEENRALKACSEFRGDVLIVESEHDTI